MDTPARRLTIRVATWLVVAIPATWGVVEVIRKSVALFH
jgi:hypothetical protein